MNDEDRKAFDRWLDDWCQAGGFAPSIESTWQAALEYARKWRPISEAPKDGTPFALIVECSIQVVDSATGRIEGGTWYDMGDSLGWQPLESK